MHTVNHMQLSNVFSKYGAPMGRVDKRPQSGEVVKLHLQHMPLDSGGYDSGGAYWGLRFPQQRTVICTPIGSTKAVERTFSQTPKIYRYYNKDGTIEGFIDAFDREDAKAQILEDYPAINFYR